MPPHDEETTPAEPLTGVWIALGVVVIALAALIAGAMLVPWPRAAQTAVLQRNAQGLADQREARESRLVQIADTIRAFRAEHSAAPASLDQLRAFEPLIDDMLAAPPYSLRAGYEIDFSALASPRPAIVIDDPGYAFPAFPPVNNHSPPDLDPFRAVLLKGPDDSLAPAGYLDALRRGVPIPSAIARDGAAAAPQR